jgi:membrane protease YdiL (CAAX protease family)
MPEKPNTLEVLVRVPTEAEASLIVQSLADQGISAKAIGGYTSGFKADAPGDVSVVVKCCELAHAAHILAAVRQSPSAAQAADNEADQPPSPSQSPDEEPVAFPCEECGAKLMFAAERCGFVEICPNCGSYVDVPEHPSVEPTAAASQLESGKSKRPEGAGSGSRTSAQLWIEVLAVLCLAYVPDLYAAIGIAAGWFPVEFSPVQDMLFLIIRSLRVAVPLLVIVALSKDPWPLFGIVRPKWIVDGAGGCVLAFGCVVAHGFAMSLLPPTMLTSPVMVPMVHRAESEGILALFLAFLALCANSFAEEFVMRGYLIARLERLLRSTWQAVLVTTVLFASYHLYQGFVGTVSAAAFGLVCAVSFCFFRRLWPLCVAHTIWNFWIV